MSKKEMITKIAVGMIAFGLMTFLFIGTIDKSQTALAQEATQEPRVIKVIPSRFHAVDRDQPYHYVIDENTGVYYIVSKYNGGICPAYKADGTLLTVSDNSVQ